MRHLLVPTDFSDTAQHALEYALAMCQDTGGKITLLHVSHPEKVAETLIGLDAVEYLSRTLNLPPDPSRCAPSFDVETLKNVAQQELQKCVNASGREKVTIETAIEHGRPSLKIVQYAHDHSVDLIVIGTHGRGPVAHFFLGSVAENVVRSASCPVLTVRGKSVPSPAASEPCQAQE